VPLLGRGRLASPPVAILGSSLRHHGRPAPRLANLLLSVPLNRCGGLRPRRPVRSSARLDGEPCDLRIALLGDRGRLGHRWLVHGPQRAETRRLTETHGSAPGDLCFEQGKAQLLCAPRSRLPNHVCMQSELDLTQDENDLSWIRRQLDDLCIARTVAGWTPRDRKRYRSLCLIEDKLRRTGRA